MPTYEYECKNGHRFERLQAFSDKPLKKCDQCGASAKRLISGGSGLIFKGSGFYITDYKRKEQQRSSAGDTASKGDKSSETAKPSGESASPAPPAAPSSGSDS